MKNMFVAAAMTTVLAFGATQDALAFGPLGAMVQNAITEQIKETAATATNAAIGAVAEAAVSGTALEGNTMVNAVATTAAGAATGQNNVAGSIDQAGATASALSNSSGAGRAFLLGNLAVGAAAKGLQGNNAQGAANGTGGVAYTLGSDTAQNIHAMGKAYNTALAQCGQDQGCSQCVMSDFQTQSASSVGKTGTYTMGSGCVGTTTASTQKVEPAAGQDSVKWSD